jgi:hypothetical protein
MTIAEREQRRRGYDRGMLRKRRYSEMSSAGKAAVLVITAISLVIIGTAERDIQSRDEDEVRGSRALWRLVSLNALGAIAYLRFGRRR